jgi:uncharacterized protein
VLIADATHRPWPPPRRRWLMAMCWLDLLFVHWPAPAETLRPFIPAGLELETFDGTAWIGVVPFRMVGVHPRVVPSLPWLSAFPEVNVRTYVTAGGKPGVWFFSLDAGNPLAVRLARRLFHLPYYDARLLCVHERDAIRYASTRTMHAAPAAAFAARYRPVGPIYRSMPGSLEYWLTERYCLYSANRAGAVFRVEVQHRPWPLQPAEVVVEHNSMTASFGLTLPDTPPLLHFAQRLDVVAWNRQRVPVAP